MMCQEGSVRGVETILTKLLARKVVLLTRCVNPQKVQKLAEAPGLIEQWDGHIRRLTVDFSEKLSDGVTCGLLLEMMPA